MSASPTARADIDPITLAVVRGALETAQREMTMTMERTGRSSVLTISRDFSNAIFNWTPEMVVQGQDLPIHLGSLILATKAVAAHFEGDLHPGDVVLHNDPVYDGSHIADWCMYKPVFFEDELVFWAVSKGHMADAGGPVAGSYNPDAKDIFAEGLRIPPIKICEEGRDRADILNMLVANTRTPRNQAGDLRAQRGAVNVGERQLLAILEKYGKAEVKACTEQLLDLADAQMREVIASLPDGTHTGERLVEDIGHGLGDMRVGVEVSVAGDTLKVSLEAEEQLPFYTNSFRANTTSAVYLGVLMFLKPPPPYNEGMYRAIEIDYGPPGTMVNAADPAAHVASTTCPAETITDAVRDTLSVAYPERATAGWGHCAALNLAGVDPRSEREYVHMMVSCLMCGAGAIGGVLDGWHAIGPQAGLGGATSGEMEVLEYHYPLIVHSYLLRQDSGCPGEWRGGCGITHEVEAVGHEMTTVVWGEGRKYPASSVLGAGDDSPAEHIGRVELVRGDGSIEEMNTNRVVTLAPGERFITHSAGGGGIGAPTDRDPELVLADVREGFVSAAAARERYGVVLDEAASAVDVEATQELRKERTGA